MQYAYGRSDHRLEADDFAPEYHDVSVEAGKMGGLMKQMIWIFHFMQTLPEWLVSILLPGLALVLRLQRVKIPNIRSIEKRH